ncbi:MAG TPA: type IX secretion system protein PorQ [Cyclobacteriaceae bacterium]|nr:type IX secretion system protein PorQ [Cyclobacteriaceae bacterium]
MACRCVVFALCFVSTALCAQTSLQSSYGFLDVPGNARLAGLGGVNVSLTDRDVNFFFSNPALAGDSLVGWGSAGYQFYVADVHQTTFAYSARLKKIGPLQVGVRHMDYGVIEGYDPSGAALGKFRSNETAIVISKGHTLSNYRLGVSMKGVFSSLAGFRSAALLFDVGGVFVHPDQDLTIGLVVKNIGVVLSEYSVASETTLPFDVQAGVTFRPEHMPVRFSLTVHDLVDVDDTYYDPVESEPGTLDKVLRHVNFGVELLLHQHFSILAGYNFRRHKELKLEEAGGAAGLTVGFSARVKQFEFTLSRSSYIVGTAAYNITLAADINRMLKRRQIL